GESQAEAVQAGLDEAGDESFPASDPPAIDYDRDADGPTVPHPGGPQHDWPSNPVQVALDNDVQALVDHGHVVIAAITSCTNTSNPAVMIGAALLAKKAVERGLSSKPWVKTSLAPGSRVVTDYYDRAGLTPFLEKLGFGLVGYGCTTCIGNSGPLIPQVSAAVNANDLTVCSVLSGNRNFEGRIHPEVKMNFLTSPPLVIAYALAGTMLADILNDPLGHDVDGEPVYLRDIWPNTQEIAAVIDEHLHSEMFTRNYSDVFTGDDQWRSLDVAAGQVFAWDDSSTYVRRPPYFDGMQRDPEPVRDIAGARVLAVLGDSVTTDHISPAGAIKTNSPAGEYLQAHGVATKDFNSYGSRRGNHDVMIRGTFANIRLRNQLAPGTEGGVTRYQPDGQNMSIFDAAARYAAENVPLIILAGAEYGSGSSRDWAAKGTLLLGVKAVLATSFERIHRSNLIGMGVLPLQFAPGDTVQSLALTGEEEFSITGVTANGQSGPLPGRVTVRATHDGQTKEFTTTVRIDTPAEAAYYRHGGILQYVLRQLLKK
ncbi:MAG: aconitate hydratase AcnA, partial [Nakamurella sp.]